MHFPGNGDVSDCVVLLVLQVRYPKQRHPVMICSTPEFTSLNDERHKPRCYHCKSSYGSTKPVIVSNSSLYWLPIFYSSSHSDASRTMVNCHQYRLTTWDAARSEPDSVQIKSPATNVSTASPTVSPTVSDPIETLDRDTDLSNIVWPFLLLRRANMSSHRSTSPTHASSEEVGSWSATIVWKSFKTKEWERYLRIRRCHTRKNSPIQDSPFIPSSFQDYIGHRIAMLEDDIQALKFAIKTKEAAIKTRMKSPQQLVPVFGGKDMSKATELLRKSVPVITAEDVLYGKSLDAEPDFVMAGRLWLGEELLKWL